MSMVVTIRGAQRVDRALARLGSRFDPSSLLNDIGAEVEDQTRDRIANTKRAPDGSDWDEWSEKYAASKHGESREHAPHPGKLVASEGHSLLQLDGPLLDSIQYEVRGGDVVVGSNLKYAGSVNYDRLFLGLSPADEDDVDDIVEQWIRRQLR